MHRLLVLTVALAAGLGMSSAADAAVRLKPIAYCPVAANYAFKVVGARGEYDGVASEYQWLARTLPGWKRDTQALISDNKGRAFDLLMISKSRKTQVLCFDITGFFGKSG
jgi:hypothetical protein